MPLTLEKTPGSVCEGGVDWTDWLAERGNDTISSSSWAASHDSITIDSDEVDGAVALVYLSDGLANKEYLITNTIITTGGLTEPRSIAVRVLAHKYV